MRTGRNAAPLLRRVLAQGGYETLTTLRNGEQLLVSIVLPVLALIGIVGADLFGPEARSVDVAVPGVLALAVMSSAFTGQGIATGFDRRYGVLAYLSTTPLGPAGLLWGKALSVLVVLVVQTVVIGVVGLFLGWRPEVAGLPATALVMVLGAGAFTALGLLLAGTARAEATLALTNLLWVLLGAVGGTVFPLPPAIAPVAQFLPSAALGQGLRDALLEGAVNGSALLVLVAWTAVAAAAAVRWFKWR